MNQHAKRLVKELETLGFRRDHDAQTRGIAYRHPNDPARVIKVFDAMSDSSMTAARRMANKIADTGWSGPRMPLSIKERLAAQRSRETRQEAARREAEDARAADADARFEQRRERAARARRIEAEDSRRRQIESLMMPGSGR